VKRPASLRRRLLVGILAPVLALVALNAALLYRQALQAADTAYDRTLLASAKSLGELLSIEAGSQGLRVTSTLLYSALEAFEADNRSRLFYRVSGFQGELVSGFDDLPPWRGRLPDRGPYAALVDFYDDTVRGERVRVAVLLQPVAGTVGQGMATIQVAETLELRQALAQDLLVDTLWRQALIVAVIAAVVVWVVQRVTQPVRALSDELARRDEGDLASIDAPLAPPELSPLIEATNQVMARMRALLDNQKRFIRDASHQLRTPLEVLKTQVQSAQRGDAPPQQALQEIGATVERATELANQMLAMAKVEQMVDQGGHHGTDLPVVDLAQIARDVALDLAPLMVERRIDFDISTAPALVRSHVWPVRELTRNLLHNAIRFSGDGQTIWLTVATVPESLAELRVCDQGPGLSPEQRSRLFTPFASSRPPPRAGLDTPPAGSGLGLVICRGIAQSLGGTLRLDNRIGRDGNGRTVVAGLDAVACLPQAPPTPAPVPMQVAAPPFDHADPFPTDHRSNHAA
jgi:two-component system, OmpR family, sensor histidine kinase TctE